MLLQVLILDLMLDKVDFEKKNSYYLILELMY